MKNILYGNFIPKNHILLTRILRIMKLEIIFILIFCMGISAKDANSQNSKVNIASQNSSVKDVMNEIEKQTEYLFLYNQDEVDLNWETTVNAQGKEVSSVLTDLFGRTNIKHVMVGNNIVLMTKGQTITQQTRGRITGSVMDERGEPIIGANIVEKNTTNGVITDVDGKFELIASEQAILQISYIGYIIQELSVKKQKTLSIILKEDTQNLDEVVVIGYGQIRKSDLTGSVSQVRADVLSNQPVLHDPLQGLQGKVPGLDITIGNKPGDSSSPIIRGYNSINASNSPLIVLDGAPFGGKMSDINPSEIEAIDVLKDASSTAIYGSRGANGVIIITTKRGKMDGKVAISYDGSIGFSKSFKNFNLMDGDKWSDYLRASNPGKFDNELFTDVLDVLNNKEYVDWQDEMFSGTGFQTDNNISVQVGKDNMTNLIILGYNKNQSIIENMWNERFSLRINGDIKLLKNLKMGYSTMLSHTNRSLGNDEVFRTGTLINPVTKIYDEAGKYKYYPSPHCVGFLQINPYYYISDEYLENKQSRDRIFLNLYADWNISENLNFRTSLTPDYQFIEEGNYNSPYINLMTYNSLSYRKRSEKSLTFTNILNYKKRWGIHNIDASLVHDMQTYVTDYLQLTGENIPYYGKWYNVNEAPELFSRSSNYNKWALLSYMGRINYTLLDRYLFTITGRYDGSSRLADGNKWDFFPSVAFAWRILSEPFLQDIDAISNLKLRLSWGNTGNTAISTYSTLGSFSRQTYVFGMNDNAAIGYLPAELPNSSLGWERTEEYNIGIDFGFLKNRIEGSLDLYKRNTHDLLMQRNLPITTGYSSTWQNIGKTSNSGVEIALNTIPFVNKNWEWSVGLTFAYNKNEITELYDGQTSDYGNKWFVGKPLYVELLYKYAGVWQTDESETANEYGYEPGNPKVKDVNKNKKYDQEDQFIFNKIPKVTGGLSTALRYKNWDMNLYFYTRLGYGEVLPILTHEAGSSRFNHLDVDFWTKDNPTNESPKPIGSNSQNLLIQSDYAYKNLSFIRLKNVNIGYTFMPQIIEKIKANKLRVYMAVDNPFVWTFNKFEGIDPENGISYTSHRPMTSFVFGLNVSF